MRVAAFVLALVIVIEGLFITQTLFVLPNSSYFAAIFASVLVDQTNEKRLAEKLGGLTPNPLLEKAAQLKADDMAEKGYFSHNAPDGTTPWHWFNEVGYNYAAAGENLAVNFTDSKDVTEAWLSSPTHRANIMNANYTEIGIATAHGTYKGKDAIFVVQEFGRPSLVARQTESVSSSTEEVIALISPTEKAPLKQISTTTNAAKSTTTPAVTPPVKTAPRISLLANSTTTEVAGITSEKLAVAEQLAPVDAPILTTVHTNFAQQLIASPRQTSTIIYLVLAAILALALGLAIFIKIRIQHPHLIANGILLIAVLVALILLNEAIGFTQAII